MDICCNLLAIVAPYTRYMQCNTGMFCRMISADHVQDKFNSLFFQWGFRSPRSIPGLWLLSLSLSGARQRNQGSLSIPIGFRAGIMASSFILQKGGFLTYQASFPHWIMGTHPFQPFSGLTGFAFSLFLALILYPRQPLNRTDLRRRIEELKEQYAGI